MLHAYQQILGRTCTAGELQRTTVFCNKSPSHHDLREQNQHSMIATIAKKVKLHHTEQKLEDIISSRASDVWGQIERDKYCPYIQSEFSYSCDSKH